MRVHINSLDTTMSSRLACWQSKASKFKKLCRRTINSHDRALKELKQELHMYLPAKKKGAGKQSLKALGEEDSLRNLGQ